MPDDETHGGLDLSVLRDDIDDHLLAAHRHLDTPPGTVSPGFDVASALGEVTLVGTKSAAIIHHPATHPITEDDLQTVHEQARDAWLLINAHVIQRHAGPSFYDDHAFPLSGFDADDLGDDLLDDARTQLQRTRQQVLPETVRTLPDGLEPNHNGGGTS